MSSQTRFYDVNQDYLQNKSVPHDFGKLLYVLFKHETDVGKIDQQVTNFIYSQKQKEGFPIEYNNHLIFCSYSEITPPLYLEYSVDGVRYPDLILMQVGKTNFYYTSLPKPEGNELTYHFAYRNNQGDKIVLCDPLNPVITLGAVTEANAFPHASLYRLDDSDAPQIELAHPHFRSPHKQIPSRPLYAYLPPSYYKDESKYYPVLYLHDGQNVFDGLRETSDGGWHVHHTTDRMIQEGIIEELIIIAIPHASSEYRLAEYTPSFSSQNDGLRGFGPIYLDFVLNYIKPYIDGKFRTLPNKPCTTLCGSSLGALISFWGAYTYADMVGNIGCLSPSAWFESFQGDNILKWIARKGKFPLRIYLDTGTGGESQDGLSFTREVHEALIKEGWEDQKDLLYLEEEGAMHTEAAWRRRFPHFLRFIYGLDRT